MSAIWLRRNVRVLEILGEDPAASHVLNCGYGHGSSVRQVIESVARVSGNPVAHRVVPRRAGDIAIMVADNRALVGRFAWQPRHADLDTIVGHALAWERKRAERAR